METSGNPPQSIADLLLMESPAKKHQGFEQLRRRSRHSFVDNLVILKKFPASRWLRRHTCSAVQSQKNRHGAAEASHHRLPQHVSGCYTRFYSHRYIPRTCDQGKGPYTCTTDSNLDHVIYGVSCAFLSSFPFELSFLSVKALYSTR